MTVLNKDVNRVGSILSFGRGQKKKKKKFEKKKNFYFYLRKEVMGLLLKVGIWTLIYDPETSSDSYSKCHILQKIFQ